MSLTARVEKASSVIEGSEYVDKSNTGQLNEAASYERMKRNVQQLLPPVLLGKLIEQSPQQAKSEIKIACERVISKEPWLYTNADCEKFVERYLDSIFGLGPLESLLDNEDITEIMVNGSHSFFYEREGRLFESDSVFVSDAQVYALIDKIISPLGRRVDESSPMVNARLPEGHRVNVIIPPLALDGPVVTIRKFRSKIYSLEELENMGSFDNEIKSLMKWAVRKRCNIAVSGGTGSGKTTLLNALSTQIPLSERIVTIEDSAELRFSEHPHVVRLEARPQNVEGVGEVTIKDLVINSLRMRPDRIVIGECRGSEALDMLQAMNTGHDGSLTTLHANSPAEAISRLTMMVRYGAELPVEVIENQIATALDIVIQTARSVSGKRFVSELVGYSYDTVRRKCIIQSFYKWDPIEKIGTWNSVPAWIDELVPLGMATQEEVDSWKRATSLS